MQNSVLSKLFLVHNLDESCSRGAQEGLANEPHLGKITRYCVWFAHFMIVQDGDVASNNLKDLGR